MSRRRRRDGVLSLLGGLGTSQTARKRYIARSPIRPSLCAGDVGRLGFVGACLSIRPGGAGGSALIFKTRHFCFYCLSAFTEGCQGAQPARLAAYALEANRRPQPRWLRGGGGPRRTTRVAEYVARGDTLAGALEAASRRATAVARPLGQVRLVTSPASRGHAPRLVLQVSVELLDLLRQHRVSVGRVAVARGALAREAKGGGPRAPGRVAFCGGAWPSPHSGVASAPWRVRPPSPAPAPRARGRGWHCGEAEVHAPRPSVGGVVWWRRRGRGPCSRGVGARCARGRSARASTL